MIYLFEQFSIDTGQYQLSLDGKPVPIEPLAFDLLVYLIENRERVVVRDELLENLWPGKVVSDAALGARLKDARKAVGDNGTRQAIIKTLHGRGYQFIAGISEVSENFGVGDLYTDRSDDLRTLPGKPSIAVLPFDNLSNDPEQDYFSDAIAEDIIANLCRYRELFVIHCHSTFTYREGDLDISKTAKELGVEYIAKGSIRHAGDQIKISVQLIEAVTSKAIWSENIVRKYEDLFTLESEVAAKIALSLVSHIEDESVARAARKRPEHMTAFDCVIRARQNAGSCNQNQNASARELLEQAIALDPEYASAYAYLAKTYCYEAYSEWCSSWSEVLEQAVVYARKAVELDEFDSDAHEVIGLAYLFQKRFDLSEIHLDRAVDCNPNAYSGYCTKVWLFALTGRTSEVTVCGTTALQLNPLAPDSCLMALMIAHYTESEFDAALEMLARIQQPDANSEAWRAACLAQLGRDREARVAAANAIDMGGEFIQREAWLHFWPFKNQQDLEYLVDGLYKSGVLQDMKPASEKSTECE
jgi:adenylate cyclase